MFYTGFLVILRPLSGYIRKSVAPFIKILKLIIIVQFEHPKNAHVIFVVKLWLEHLSTDVLTCNYGNWMSKRNSREDIDPMQKWHQF